MLQFYYFISRYGDFYPKSALGRLLATIWILMGIVIISLFTATVTTILLAACLANDVTLNGAHVSWPKSDFTLLSISYFKYVDALRNIFCLLISRRYHRILILPNLNTVPI